eukprot:13649307-Alexandrium_andersonii.AAC.1
MANPHLALASWGMANPGPRRCILARRILKLRRMWYSSPGWKHELDHLLHHYCGCPGKVGCLGGDPEQ